MNVLVAVVEAVKVLVAAVEAVTDMIKYERSHSFLAKSFLAKKVVCFDFGIWLPRCFGYEKEEKEKEKEESEGERKWMALFRDLIF